MVTIDRLASLFESKVEKDGVIYLSKLKRSVIDDKDLGGLLFKSDLRGAIGPSVVEGDKVLYEWYSMPGDGSPGITKSSDNKINRLNYGVQERILKMENGYHIWGAICEGKGSFEFDAKSIEDTKEAQRLRSEYNIIADTRSAWWNS